MGGNDTPIVKFLQEHNCAKLITEKNMDDKVEKMMSWLNTVSSDELTSLGHNGVEVIEKMYTKDVITREYMNLVDSL